MRLPVVSLQSKNLLNFLLCIIVKLLKKDNSCAAKTYLFDTRKLVHGNDSFHCSVLCLARLKSTTERQTVQKYAMGEWKVDW